jgi:hypothetical protein
MTNEGTIGWDTRRDVDYGGMRMHEAMSRAP